ncbi:uncharacterized protein LOC134278739 [Saccostrea cucullata]|uniref:uncharacterized protein LOC134278739 n=1 Tax=Saccostrea cuccullata TaxID=36930 RepID=UPI002ED3862B
MDRGIEFADDVRTSTSLSTTRKFSTSPTIKIYTTPAKLESVITQKTNTIATKGATSTTQTIGSRGKEFLILFMGKLSTTSGPMRILITTDSNSSVTISTSPNLDAAIKLQTDRITNITTSSKITFPFKLSCDYFKIESKAVLLQISQLSTISMFDGNDGTLVFPTNKLSTKYIVSSTNPYQSKSDCYSQFAIAALYDRTNINIKFKIKTTATIALLGGTYKNQDVFALTLEKYETFQIGHTGDLSGTLIVSTKPIAVFSGNRYQYLKGSYYGHMVAQLPPTNEFDYQYIVPPFYNNVATLIQVASNIHSSVNVSIGTGVSTLNMTDEYRNLEIKSNEVTLLESENPILVTGFGMGSSMNSPYMTGIPGVHQYLDFYKVFVPDGYTNNYLCVIIQHKFKNNLLLNGYSTENYLTVQESSSIISQNTFSILTFTVNNGTIVLSTTNNAKFGVIVYGHKYRDGYAYAGNYVLT